MIIPLNIKFKLRHNDWRRYKPNGSGHGPRSQMDLQVIAARAANQAVADELGVDVKHVTIVISETK